MDRLGYVIVFTGDMAGMRRFYEEGIGLAAREHSPEWLEFDTAGATLALAAAADPARRGVELRFLTDDLEQRVAQLSGRGATMEPPGIERHPWGRVAHLRDPEGQRLSLWEPLHPPGAGAGLPLSAAVNSKRLLTYGSSQLKQMKNVKFDAKYCVSK